MFLIPGAKLAQKVDVNTALYNTVASTRGEPAAATTVTACRAFQELRAALQEPPTTAATRTAIKRYLAALQFAIYDSNLPRDLPVGLLWVNAFDGNDHCVVSDIAIDHVAALFNLAVCEASLASVAYRTRRTNPDAMKIAARHFQVAAAYFRAAADLPSPGGIRAITCDLYPPALRSLEMAMLGNAQQVLFEITQASSVSPNAILAKFAVGARDFYLIAEDYCMDHDVVNSCINGYVGRPAGALAAYFDVVAQSAQANACRDSHDMAQQLTRLKKAQETLDIGLNTVKSLDTSSLASVAALRNSLEAELEKLKISLHQRREEAEEENRKVYFYSPAETVPPIVGRQSVKPADVSNVMKEESVDERLLPFSKLPAALSPEVSGVAARYSDMVATTVADSVSSIITASSHLHGVVLHIENSISSARSNASADASVPPPQPTSSLEEEHQAIDALQLCQKRGGLRALRELQAEVMNLASETTIQVQSIDTLLQTEDVEDRQLRAQFQLGRPESREIAQPYFTKMSSIRANLEQAANADKIVAAQIDHNATAITAAAAVDLAGFVPPSMSASMAPTPDKPGRVEALVAEIEPEITKGKQKLAEKDRLVQEFEKKKHLENPYALTSKIAPGDAEVDQCAAIIEREYGDLKNRTNDLCGEMSRISQYLSDSGVRLTSPSASNRQESDSHARMNKIYKHQAAALKFKELMSHLEQGAMFYTREQDVVATLKKDIEGFVTARGAEAQDLVAAQRGAGYPPQPGMYPPAPQYPPGTGYPPSQNYPENYSAYNQHSHSAHNPQPPNQGPPGAWRRQ